MRRMKSLMLSAVLFAGVLIGSSVYADTTNTVTNALGQVVITISDNYGIRMVSITSPNQPESPVRTYINMSGIRYDTNATTTVVTGYTPRDIGDIVIGKLATTGAVWMAAGPTTNDWKAIYDPTE